MATSARAQAAGIEGTGPWPNVRALAAPFDPLFAVPAVVAARAWLAPLLVTMLATAAGSAVLASRIAPSAPVRAKLEKAGELTKVTDRELSEQIEQARRVAIVAGVAKGLVGVPLLALLAAVATWLAARLVGARPGFGTALAVVAVTLVPVAVEQIVTLSSALRQESLSATTALVLVPSSLAQWVEAPGPVAGWKPGAALKLLSLVDFFHAWRALVFGFAFASAVGGRRAWLVPGAVALYVLVIAAATVGLPGLLESGGGR
ncbi:MAG: YIP1 family protein [Myxococcaceae bacterium]|nr:YIP1 family protein [Myxococcaceae bacterium]